MEDPRFRDTRAPARVEEAAGTVRLQKALADAGIAARRTAEAVIRDGRVRVNGRVVRELPCWVNPERDLIEVDGEVLRKGSAARGKRPKFAYVLLNKPKGVISTASDPQGRPDVVSLVHAQLPRGERIYPVGRLDADSTGLMLLTNDGELAYRLTHPRFGIGKEYHVTVQGTVDAETLARLKKGMYLAAPAAIAGSKASAMPAAVPQGRAGAAPLRSPRPAGRRVRLDEV
jgi:16S rRNA U516 pseudouridylate synthase RsuA-like enzyme